MWLIFEIFPHFFVGDVHSLCDWRFALFSDYVGALILTNFLKPAAKNLKVQLLLPIFSDFWMTV
jgi:hypothetical protein